MFYSLGFRGRLLCFVGYCYLKVIEYLLKSKVDNKNHLWSKNCVRFKVKSGSYYQFPLSSFKFAIFTSLYSTVGVLNTILWIWRFLSSNAIINKESSLTSWAWPKSLLNCVYNKHFRCLPTQVGRYGYLKVRLKFYTFGICR